MSLLLSGWAFYISNTSVLDRVSDRGTVEYGRELKRMELIQRTLVTGASVQLLQGLYIKYHIMLTIARLILRQVLH
jgi:hypothetical protein